MSCNRGCSGNWDVRCCCELNCPKKNTNKQFYNCPMKINTIKFHLGNDIGLYNTVCNDEWDVIQKTFNIDDKELDNLMDEWYEDNPKELD